jgi:hypothetical protein
MKMSYPYIVQGSNIVVVIGNVSHTISKTHITYQKVLDAIKAQDWEAVKDTIEPKKVVLNYGAGNVSIQGDELFWRGQVLDNSLSKRMITMLQEGFPIEPMVNFMENLMSNPSNRAVTELYRFLEANSLPITPDGYFLAYKKVRQDYKDVHSGTFDNSVGKVCEMERNMVNDDKDQTCSAGLHFCGMSYLRSFGGERTVIVKINPRDVVSIPTDYNDAKGRCSRYEVIGELDVAPEEAFTESVQNTAVGSTGYRPGRTDDRTKVALKFGNTPFYEGYHAGFNDIGQTPGFHPSAYYEGYEKGLRHADEGRVQKYNLPSVTSVPGAWPFPKP